MFQAGAKVPAGLLSRAGGCSGYQLRHIILNRSLSITAIRPIPNHIHCSLPRHTQVRRLQSTGPLKKVSSHVGIHSCSSSRIGPHSKIDWHHTWLLSIRHMILMLSICNVKGTGRNTLRPTADCRKIAHAPRARTQEGAPTANPAQFPRRLLCRPSTSPIGSPQLDAMYNSAALGRVRDKGRIQGGAHKGMHICTVR
jgi:hypothetical protein